MCRQKLCRSCKRIWKCHFKRTPYLLKVDKPFVGQEGLIKVPYKCVNLHQEVELGLVIGKRAQNVTEKRQWSMLEDMTARGFQDEAKKNGALWFLAKSFDTSCPVSSFINKDQIPNPHDVELFCRMNGKVQQKSKTNSMLFNAEALIAYITKYAILERGDIIVTGTPSGVGRVKSGDSIQFGLTDISETEIKVE